MKLCITCRSTKSLDSFNNCKKAKDGKQSECKTCKSEYKAKWKKANSERHNATNRASYLRNQVEIKAKHKAWKQVNQSLVNAHRASYRATKLCATPSWLTEEHTTLIADTYWLAKDLQVITGEDYRVDHIVPLKGKDVCGLHVPWNLQVLPATINLQKSNTYNE